MRGMRVYTLNFSSAWRNRLEGIYTLTVWKHPLYVYFVCRNTPVALTTWVLGRRWPDIYLTVVLLGRFEFPTSRTNLFYTINFLERYVTRQRIVKLIWSNALFQLLHPRVLTESLVACLGWLINITNYSVSFTNTIHR